jgi:chromosome segregation ATPase
MKLKCKIRPMDILQRRHAFDQLDLWVGEIRKSFIERYEDELDEEIDSLHQEIADLEKEKEDIERKMDDLESENDDLKDQIKKAVEKLKELDPFTIRQSQDQQLQNQIYDIIEILS